LGGDRAGRLVRHAVSRETHDGFGQVTAGGQPNQETETPAWQRATPARHRPKAPWEAPNSLWWRSTATQTIKRRRLSRRHRNAAAPSTPAAPAYAVHRQPSLQRFAVGRPGVFQRERSRGLKVRFRRWRASTNDPGEKLGPRYERRFPGHRDRHGDRLAAPTVPAESSAPSKESHPPCLGDPSNSPGPTMDGLADRVPQTGKPRAARNCLPVSVCHDPRAARFRAVPSVNSRIASRPVSPDCSVGAVLPGLVSQAFCGEVLRATAFSVVDAPEARALCFT